LAGSPTFGGQNREGPEAEKAGDGDGEAGGVVPLVQGAHAFLVGLVAEDEGADDVEGKGQAEADEDQDGAGDQSEAVELAHEKPGHEGGLEGADAGAGFVHAQGAAGQFNKIAAFDGGDAEPAEDFDGDAGDDLHQVLGQRVLDAIGPADGNEDEGDGEEEVANPRRKAESRKLKAEILPAPSRRPGEVEGVEGEGDDDQGVGPGDEGPVLVDFVDDAEGKQ